MIPFKEEALELVIQNASSHCHLLRMAKYVDNSKWNYPFQWTCQVPCVAGCTSDHIYVTVRTTSSEDE